MTRERTGRAAVQLSLVVWTLVILVPFCLILLLSLRSTFAIYANPLGLRGEIVWGNYREAWAGPPGGAGLGTYLRNSVVVAVTALAVALSVGVTSAYYATMLPPRGRSVFLAVFFLGSAVPVVVLLVPFFQAFSALGVLNQPVPVGVTYGVLSLPTTVLVMHAYFLEFPPELREAAAVDGLGEVRVFLKIVLPLSKGAITAVATLVAIYVWGETQLGIVLMQSPQSQTVPVGLLGFQGQYISNQGPLFAGLALTALPVLVLFLVFSRFITKGIALGGVFR